MYSTLIIMLIYYTIYAYMYKKEMNIIKMILKIKGFTKVLKTYFVLCKVKIDKEIIYSGKTCINNINSMFKTRVL